MPILGTIEWDTNKEKFLKDSEISDLVSSMDEKGLNEIEENLSTPITNEMKSGLSQEALNIGGRAPLNEISIELLKKIKISIATMESLKITARGEGNKHRQEEANEYYEKVIIEYRNRWEPVKAAQEEYNDHREYSIEKDVPDGNGGTKKGREKKHYYVCNIKYSDQEEVVLSGYEQSDPKDIDPGASVHDSYIEKVKNEITEANKFYNDYVVPAIKLKEECAGLAMLPSEIQQDATSEHFLNSNGSMRNTYTNPDGSKVEVDYNEDGKMTFKRVTDPNGNVTETSKYDKDGNITEKYEFEITEVEDGIYKSTGKKYTLDDNGNLTEDKSYKYETFEGVDKNGQRYSRKTIEEAQQAQQGKSTTSTGQVSYNYDEMRKNVNAKKDITLPPGYELVYDGEGAISQDLFAGSNTSGSGNVTLTSSNGKTITLKYNNEKDKYEVYENDQKTKYVLDPDRLAGGSNKGGSGIGNDTTLKYDTNNDGTADTIASSSATQQQTQQQVQQTTQQRQTPEEMFYDIDNDGRTDQYGKAMFEGQKYYGIDTNGNGEIEESERIEGVYSNGNNGNGTIKEGVNSNGNNGNGSIAGLVGEDVYSNAMNGNGTIEESERKEGVNSNGNN